MVRVHCFPWSVAYWIRATSRERYIRHGTAGRQVHAAEARPEGGVRVKHRIILAYWRGRRELRFQGYRCEVVTDIRSRNLGACRGCFGMREPVGTTIGCGRGHCITCLLCTVSCKGMERDGARRWIHKRCDGMTGINAKSRRGGMHIWSSTGVLVVIICGMHSVHSRYLLPWTETRKGSEWRYVGKSATLKPIVGVSRVKLEIPSLVAPLPLPPLARSLPRHPPSRLLLHLSSSWRVHRFFGNKNGQPQATKEARC